MLKKIKRNPMHSILGLVLILTGVDLVMRDEYFVWPPAFSRAVNDNWVGSLYIIVGVMIIYWVFDRHQTARWDHVQLTAAAVLMTLLTVYQFVHFFVLGLDMPWISNLAVTAYIVQLAKGSVSSD
jgi:uncharacterized membrane protein HdeD (DUF308 family)